MNWQLVQFLLKQAGVDKRTGDLYGNRDFLNIARNMARGLKVWWYIFSCFYSEAHVPVAQVFSCISQGVENVYTQHQPLVFQTMESIVKGRLRDVDYPYVGNHFQQARSVISPSFFEPVYLLLGISRFTWGYVQLYYNHLLTLDICPFTLFCVYYRNWGCKMQFIWSLDLARKLDRVTLYKKHFKPSSSLYQQAVQNFYSQIS